MIKQWSLRAILVLVLLCPNLSVWAAPTEYKEWNIPQFGKLLVDADTHIGAIDSVKDLIQAQQGKIKSPEWIIWEKEADAQLQNINLGMYQLTKAENQMYRQAWVIGMQYKEPNAAMTKFFQGPATIDKKVQALAIYAEAVSKIGSMSFDDPKTNIHFKVNEISSPEFLMLSGQTVVSCQVRALFESQGFMFPLTVRGYATASDQKLSMLMMVVQDSERDYWTDVMRTSFANSAAAKVNE